MREDRHTTDLAGAAAYDRHQSIDPLATDHGITAADVDFEMNVGHNCGGDPSCWSCFVLPQARAALAAELRRLG